MSMRSPISRFSLAHNPRAALLTAALLWTAALGSDDAVQPGTYEITTQTVMPNLEENLRYTRTQERRCLRAHDLRSVFSVLQYPAFEGCRLGKESRRGETIHYVLLCDNPWVATGRAQLNAARGRIAGRLEVKMGGKNMKFSQRVEATRQGECGIAQQVVPGIT